MAIIKSGVKSRLSSQWPQVTEKPSKRRREMKSPSVSNPYGTMRNVTTSREQNRDDDDDDDMSIDSDADSRADELNAYAALAVGHLILDDPAHPLYHQHVASLVKTCGSDEQGRFKLQQLIGHLRGKAEEMGVAQNVDYAVAAITSAWADRLAAMMADIVTDQETMAEVVAGLVARRGHGRDMHFSPERFFGDVQSQIDRRKNIIRQLTSPPPERAQDESYMSGALGSRAHDEAVTATDEGDQHAKPSLELIANNVDLYWRQNQLDHVPKEAAKALIAAAFSSPQDLFVTNHVAESEFEAYQQHEPLNVEQLYHQAVSDWETLQPDQKSQFEVRFKYLRDGNVAMLAAPELDGMRQTLKERYRGERQSLSRDSLPPNAKNGGYQQRAMSESVAPSVGNRPGETFVMPTVIKEEDEAVEPPISQLSAMNAPPVAGMQAAVPQDAVNSFFAPAKQLQTATAAARTGHFLQPPVVAPPAVSSQAAGPASRDNRLARSSGTAKPTQRKGGVLATLDCDKTQEEMDEYCGVKFQKLGFIGVVKLPGMLGCRWVVRLRNAKAAIKAADRMRLKNQLGSLELLDDDPRLDTIVENGSHVIQTKAQKKKSLKNQKKMAKQAAAVVKASHMGKIHALRYGAQVFVGKLGNAQSTDVIGALRLRTTVTFFLQESVDGNHVVVNFDFPVKQTEINLDFESSDRRNRVDMTVCLKPVPMVLCRMSGCKQKHPDGVGCVPLMLVKRSD